MIYIETYFLFDLYRFKIRHLYPRGTYAGIKVNASLILNVNQ